MHRGMIDPEGQYRRLVMLLCSLSILSLMTAVFGYVWYHYYAYAILQPFYRRGHWAVIGVYAVVLYLFTRIFGGYRVGDLSRGEIIYSCVLSMLFSNGVAYLQISLIGRHLMAFWPIAGMCVVQTALIILWAVGTGMLYGALYAPHRVLVVYGDKRAEHLVYKMSEREEKYEVCEAVSIAEGDERIFERILHYDSVLLTEVRSEDRNRILKFCFMHAVRTYLSPKISDTIVRGADSVFVYDTPLLLCHNMGLTFEQRLLKRALDLVGSALALLLLSPVMAAVALCIKCYDGGPVLYRQKRLTLDGREFEVYKFRSMVVDAERDGPRLAARGDSRVTPVGRFIRSVRLDELPQLINIFKGEMSIVGPRPERPEIAREYEKAMPEFSFRLRVKAGLTGYAQVMGRYNTTPYDKLRLDLMYIENYSFLLDLRIILMTVKILLVPESTEGVTPGATTAMKPDDKPAKKPRGKTR